MRDHTIIGPKSKWAVCPKLDIEGDAKIFDSEEAAKGWLQSHGNREWLEDPLPVISRGACIGPVFLGPRLSGWLRADIIAPLPDGATTPGELAESALQELRGQTAWPTYYLDEDWRFESLEEQSFGLEGHGYTDRRASSVPEVVFKAVSDFDALMSSAYGAVPTSAVVSFWQSWQVHRHINQLCKELETSKTARILRADFHDCDHAKWTVRSLVNTYARQMCVEGLPGGGNTGESQEAPTILDLAKNRNAYSQGIAKGAMVTDSAFWRDLEGLFRALPDPMNELTAFKGGDEGNWIFVGGSRWAVLDDQFRSLARRAAIAAGAPDRENALDWWFSQLVEGKDRFYIKQAILKSAVHCVELATRAFELEAAASVPPERTQSTDIESAGADLAQLASEAPTKGRKRGPKPDFEVASRVAEVVERVAPDGDWRAKLDDICEALDEEKIPIPRTWRRERQYRYWSDCLERPIAVKAIEYRLETANQRLNPTPETLS